MKALVTLLACLTCLTNGLATPPVPRNGYWWKKQSSQYKTQYLEAARDGMAAGLIIAIPRGFGTEYTVDALLALDERSIADIAKATDRFYSDPRNMQIGVSMALGVAVKELSGATPDELRRMTDALRSMAAAGKAAGYE